MKQTAYITVFCVIVLVQWVVPGNMIWQEENTIRHGKAYKFRTEPIDPNDPFRGKYIVLNFEVNSFQVNCPDWTGIEEVYVYIEEDAEGFARATHVSPKLLESDQDYVIANVWSCYHGELRFGFPFTTYYMEETKAYKAELAVGQAQRDTSGRTCYALVYIRGERAVLHDVLIDDVSVREYVEEH